MGTVWRGSDLKVLGLCLGDDLTQKTNTCDDQEPRAAAPLPEGPEKHYPSQDIPGVLL